MPRYQNTLQTPIGNAMRSLGEAFFSGPSQGERQQMQAQTRAYQSLADKRAAEAAAKRSKMGARTGIAQAFQNVDYSGEDYQSSPRQVVQNAAPTRESIADFMGRQDSYIDDEIDTAQQKAVTLGTAGGLEQDSINGMMRNMLAAYGGSDDDLIRARAAGSTGAIGQNEAVSLPGQTRIREDNQAQEMDLQQSKNRTQLAERGMIEQGDINEIFASPLKYDPDETVVPHPDDPRTKGEQGSEARIGERVMRGENVSPQQAAMVGAEADGGANRQKLMFQGPEGTVRMGSFDPDDGNYYFANGEQVPQQGWQAYNPAQPEGSSEDVGLTTSSKSQVQQTEMAMRRFEDLLGQTREAAQDPSNFGFPGFVKGTVQDVQALSEGLASGLGYDGLESAVADARNDIARNPDVSSDILSGVFDPSLPRLQTLSDLLVYQAASALAGQSGRSVSDRDVKIFKNVVGDPQSFFSSKEKFLSKLGTMEDMVKGQREALRPGQSDQRQDAPQAGGEQSDAGPDQDGWTVERVD